MQQELDNLLEAFSKLRDEEQIKEVEEKIKTLIGLFNEFNENKELLLASTEDKKDENANLTKTFNLLCCLEEEIAKFLENKI